MTSSDRQIGTDRPGAAARTRRLLRRHRRLVAGWLAVAAAGLAVALDDADGAAATGAVHEGAQRSTGRGEVESGVDGHRVGDVCRTELDEFAELGGDLGALRRGQVDDHDVNALFDESFDGGQAETGRTAGHDGRRVGQLHVSHPFYMDGRVIQVAGVRPATR